MGIKSKGTDPARFTGNFTKLLRSRRWPLAGAFAVSLVLHSLWLSLDFGSGLGLPGLAFPWQERRTEVPEIRVVLEPAVAVVAALPPVSPPSPPSPPAAPAPPAPLSPEDAPAPTQASGGFTAVAAAPLLAASDLSLTAAVEKLAPTEPVQPPITSADLPPPPAEAHALGRTAVAGDLPSTPDPQASLIAMARFDAAALRVPAVPRGLAGPLAAAPAASSSLAVAPEVRQAAAMEAARLAAERLAAAAQVAGRAARAQAEALAQEAARQEAARLAAERQRAQVLDSARQEAERQQTARAALARQEAAALEAKQLEATRLDAAKREAAVQAAARLQAEREEAARKLAERQEAAKQELARQDATRQEAARQQATKDAARLDALRSAAADEVRREERLRAIGRQLNEEAAQREAAASAAAKAARSLPSASPLRRGRLFGLADPDTEMVLYAEAWARKIQLNQTFELVREAAKRTHVDPLVTVAVRRDGSIESVSFVRSSGVAELDDAIRRVVHSQLPYQAFSPALAREYDVIEIRRSWHLDMAIRLY